MKLQRGKHSHVEGGEANALFLEVLALSKIEWVLFLLITGMF